MLVDEKLAVYKNLLIKWQKSLNLVAPSTLDKIEQRHFEDSKQVFDLVKNKNKKIFDLGSGAGFPGLVLAIMGCSQVNLVESDQKKSIFLQNVSRETMTPVVILNQRIETISQKADIITARALATVELILELSKNMVNSETQYILLKSQNAEEELTSAARHWYFDHEFIASRTDPRGQIIILSNIKKRSNDGQ